MGRESFFYISVSVVTNFVVLNLFIALLLDQVKLATVHKWKISNAIAKGSTAIDAAVRFVKRKRRTFLGLRTGNKIVPTEANENKSSGSNKQTSSESARNLEHNIRASRQLQVRDWDAQTEAESECSETEISDTPSVAEEPLGQVKKSVSDTWKQESKEYWRQVSSRHSVLGMLGRHRAADAVHNAAQDNSELNIDSEDWEQMQSCWRRNAMGIISHPAYQVVALGFILWSCTALMFEDVNIHDNHELQNTLYTFDVIFAVYFPLEVVLVMSAIGVGRYFRSFWNWLDLILAAIAIAIAWASVALSVGAHGVGLTSLRVLRAFRPLRVVSHFDGARRVVDSLVGALPGISNVFFVCVLFWLVFSIAGVNLFGGQFYKCVDENGYTLAHTVVADKTACNAADAALNYRWVNSLVTFDTVFDGMLALFQYATLEGWIEVMQDAVDSAGIDQQPIRENRPVAYVFFVIFMIVGSFFVLNLFVGAIVDSYNTRKFALLDAKKLDPALIPRVRRTAIVMDRNPSPETAAAARRVVNMNPVLVVRPPGPSQKFRRRMYQIAVSSKFEHLTMVVVLVNFVVLSCEHWNQPSEMSTVLLGFEWMFAIYYALEAAIKIAAFKKLYFHSHWNIFAFTVAVLSFGTLASSLALKENCSNCHWSGVGQAFRALRVLRLTRAMQWTAGILRLTKVFVRSFRELLHVGLLLLVSQLIFSSIAMALFKDLKRNGSFNQLVNAVRIHPLTPLFDQVQRANPVRSVFYKMPGRQK